MSLVEYLSEPFVDDRYVPEKAFRGLVWLYIVGTKPERSLEELSALMRR